MSNFSNSIIIIQPQNSIKIKLEILILIIQLSVVLKKKIYSLNPKMYLFISFFIIIKRFPWAPVEKNFLRWTFRPGFSTGFSFQSVVMSRALDSPQSSPFSALLTPFLILKLRVYAEKVYVAVWYHYNLFYEFAILIYIYTSINFYID